MTSATESQLLTDVADIKTFLIRREACQQKVERLHAWAFGNGTQGADDTVRWLVEREKARNRWSWSLWNMVPSITTGVVVGVVIVLVQCVF